MIRKIYFALLATILVAVSSCSDKQFHAGDGTGNAPNAKFLIELPYRAAGNLQTKASVPATDFLIHDLEVLAFTKGSDGELKFSYRVSADNLYTTNNGTNYLCEIPLDIAYGDEQYFVFIANMPEVVGAVVKDAEGTGKGELMEKLKFSTCDFGRSDNNGLPMWGETVSPYSATSTSSSAINKISLLRSMASIDIVVNDSDFRLTSVGVYDIAETGFIAPAAGNYTLENGVYTVLAPSVCGDTGMTQPYVVEDGIVSGNTLRGRIFVPEFSSGEEQDEQAPCLLIGGYYGKDNTTEETWYKVNITSRENNVVKAIDLLRNHRYSLNIIQVSSKGYATKEEAYNNSPENIRSELTLSADVAGGLNNVAYNGNEYLATNFAELDTNELLEILTNAQGGWTLTQIPDWLEVSSASGSQGERAAITFSVRQQSDEKRSASLLLSAGRLQLQIVVNENSGVSTYLSAKATKVITPGMLGYNDISKFTLGGGIALHGNYLYAANSYHEIKNNSFTHKPELIVYDLNQNKTVKKISEWERNGEKLDFSGSTQWPDIIDDIAVDESQKRLYVMRRQSCIEVFDINDPVNPVYVTRIGKLLETVDDDYRLANSSAVGISDKYVLVRTAGAINTYDKSVITSQKWQNIKAKTSNRNSMPNLKYCIRQFATDPQTQKIYLTEYGDNSFMGVYALDLSGVDKIGGAEAYQWHEVREWSILIDFHPTGMAFAGEKVYFTTSEGELKMFGRSILSPQTRAGSDATATIGVEGYQFGTLAKLYPAVGDGKSFWSCDKGRNNIVCFEIGTGIVSIQ